MVCSAAPSIQSLSQTSNLRPGSNASLILMHGVGEIHRQGAWQVYGQGAAGEVHGQSGVVGVHQLVAGGGAHL